MQSPRAEAAPRERERRQALLLRLMQGQRDTNDSDAIMSAAADAIGRYLGANRAGFLEMVDEDTLNYGPSWTDGKLPPLRGLSSAHDMGTRYVAAVRAGHTLAISDMASDPLTSDSTFAELGVRSGIGAPIFRGGRWLAGLYVHQTEARVWTRREVELVRVVAEQTWDAVERARAVLALRESEAQLRFLDALGEAARDSVDASAMMKLTVRMLGEHLKVNWCAYANVEADNDQFTILDDWTDEGLSRIGTYRLHRFGPRVTADLRAGRAVIIDDADRQFAAGEELEASQKSGIKALICYPHVSAGRLLAMMAVFQTSPRRWTEHEIGLVAAVVERSWAHIERIRSRQRLIDADRSKDEFLAMLAHELRNPLAPIRNASEVLGRTLPSQEAPQVAVGIIKRQVTQLTRLVDDLLDVSRITQGRIELRKEPLELASVIDHAVETVGPMLREKHHEILIAPSEDPLYVTGDSARLTQCVVNLLTNAIKYTDSGGHIRVHTRRSDSVAVVTISDDGAGIPRELLPRIFDLFVQGDRTLDRAQGGLGIGLSVLKKLIEMHGGEVSARSPGVGHGSSFEIRLPLIEEPGAMSPGSTGERAPRRRVLVVDDNVDAANSLALVLRLDGHETEAVYTAYDALEHAATFKPDVVLLDIGLPQLDGYEVARRLRSSPELRGICLVALTGYGQSEDRQRARAAGFDFHLVKPVDFELLARTLSSAAMRH